MHSKSPLKFFVFAIFLIAIDQASKLAVNHYMVLGEEIPVVGQWLKLHYILNEGMAFGFKIGLPYGKLILTVFRLFAGAGICYLIANWAKHNVHSGLLWAMALILAGAIGNVVDSTFYGVYLHNAPIDSPSPWFHGQVIDMVFADVWQGYLPEWIPRWGGEWFSMPIFNLADSFIFIGVCTILIFQGTFFPKLDEYEDSSVETQNLEEEVGSEDDKIKAPSSVSPQNSEEKTLTNDSEENIDGEPKN